MRRRILIVIVALGILILIGLPLSSVLNATSPLNVTMERFNLNRNAVDTNETILNTSNVNVNTFGKLFSDPVDADIYTQPLIVHGVNIPGKGTHNVVYVATMHNTVYAFDADKVGAPLWSKNLGPSWHGDCHNCDTYPDLELRDIPGGEVGVLGTPVIDTSTNTMYLVSQHDGNRNVNPYIPPTHELHALDITTGAEKFGGPVVITATIPGANGMDEVNGFVTFDSGIELQRPGLVLLQGRVLVAIGAAGDVRPHHGWLFAYNASNLKATPAAWLTTPQGFGGGLWMAGVAPVIDSNNNIYVVTGNGDYGATTNDNQPPAGANLGNYGDSVVKLSLDTTHNKFNVLDYFTPWNTNYLEDQDLDLGDTDFVLIPGTHLLFGGGKTNALFLVDSNNLGKYICDQPVNNCADTNNGDNNDTQVVQEWNGKVSHLHNTPNVWVDPNGNTLVYVFAEQDFLKDFKFVPGPNGTGSFPGNPPIANDFNGLINNNGMPSGMVSISSNGKVPHTGIAWTTDYKSNFRAVDATNLNDVLWTDSDSPRDGIGVAAKFVVPVVNNGKVYMGTRSGRLTVYGLLPTGQGAGSITAYGRDLSPSTINLSTPGGLDWAHWGNNINITSNPTGFDHKTVGGSAVGLISPVVVKGGGPLGFNNSQIGFTWTDGTPTTAQTASTTGLFSGIGQAPAEPPSFLFTVPADTTPRVLTVYVGLFSAQGQLRATLSDGSAPDFVDTTDVNLIGADYRVYTLIYQAASANQTLFVTWSMIKDNGSGSGNVTFQAAALNTYSPPDTLPQPEFQPPTNTPSVPTATITPSPGPSLTPTRTPTPLPPDSFRLRYEALNIDPTELRIRAAINIVNMTSADADMQQFTVRYYFTKDSTTATPVFTCEVAVITCTKVHGGFGSITPAVAGADTYLDLTFDPQNLPMLGGSSGAIVFNITKNDGTSFNQSDDFSFNANLTAFTDWRQIAMLDLNTLIWGAVPTLGNTTLFSPANGALNQLSHPTLSWTASPDASRYQVRIVSISKNALVFQKWYSAFNDLSSCPGSTCSAIPNVTLPDGQYNWFVQTGTPTQTGPWTDAWTFKVGP